MKIVRTRNSIKNVPNQNIDENRPNPDIHLKRFTPDSRPKKRSESMYCQYREQCDTSTHILPSSLEA